MTKTPLNSAISFMIAIFTHASGGYWVSGFAAGVGFCLFLDWLNDFMKTKRV